MQSARGGEARDALASQVALVSGAAREHMRSAIPWGRMTGSTVDVNGGLRLD